RARRAARPPRQTPRAAQCLSHNSTATLPRSARLLRREQFAAVLAHGAAGVRRHFVVFAKPNGLHAARIGIVVGRRAAPRAVDRNRIKRMVREAFRRIRSRLGGVDVVVQLRRCPPRGSEPAARAELARLFAEIEARAAGG
ncbi:MAG TPA: ribonuclease P protein component, partial [Burkholderiales bacterium]|nr:ribonuclease P protein component [Burkholderiales bacterium]